MIYEDYTIGGVLYHSGGGRGKHKYIEKRISKNGKTYYVYNYNPNTTFGKFRKMMDTPLLSKETMARINDVIERYWNEPITRKQEKIREKKAAHWNHKKAKAYYNGD